MVCPKAPQAFSSVFFGVLAAVWLVPEMLRPARMYESWYKQVEYNIWVYSTCQQCVHTVSPEWKNVSVSHHPYCLKQTVLE